MAHRLETPPPPPPAPPPASPQANLDKVMWRWMSDWGKWHYEENSELLFSISAHARSIHAHAIHAHAIRARSLLCRPSLSPLRHTRPCTPLKLPCLDLT